MVGVVFDSSGVHDDREQAARALDTMATAYAIVDSDWTVRYVNQAARVLVAQRREPVGTPIWDLVPGLGQPVSRRPAAQRDGGAKVRPASSCVPSGSAGGSRSRFSRWRTGSRSSSPT